MTLKTILSLTLIAILIILSAGCIDNDNNTSTSQYLSTQHVSGINQNVIIDDCSTLHVSGVDNTIRVINNNIKRIYVSGVDNIIYIPSSSSPITSVSGVGCNVIRR